MKEREYSFKVENVKKYIDCLIKLNFKIVSDSKQIRTIYKNNSNIMARITENFYSSNKKEIVFDFKEDKLTKDVLIERKESLPIIIDNVDTALSVIDILGFKKTVSLHRQRKVFSKNDVICEIDLYESPNEEFIVSIEGDNYKGVDKLYFQLKGLENE